MIMIQIPCGDDRAGECNDGMDAYVARHGWHFSEAAVEYAAGLMTARDSKPLSPLSVEDVDAMLATYGVKLAHKEGHDRAYVANMARADFWKSSIEDEKHLALYVKDVVDDVDAPEGHVLRRWVADMEARGVDIDWEGLV